MEQDRDELAAAMLSRLRADLASYATLVSTEHEGPVIDMARLFLGYYIHAFRRRELPDAEESIVIRAALLAWHANKPIQPI
ncbi:MAG TPA: hypothetical protein VFY98_11955 [Intrasporangium sp.]|nr:hypothetical protein [Intrasporangium sp.]